MSDERLHILKMLEEGKITAEEASQLLEALNAAEAEAQGGPEAQGVWESPRKARWMRIEVTERHGNRVHIKLPVAIVRAALRLGGGHLSIGGFDSEELGPELMAELERALLDGEMGLLVDVVEEDGDHVQIYLE
ncbi:MAG TPA: hypothetical protein EYP25_03975 [Anaerolineae bacterium]|nr:DUF2244 domain-containing protein [Caldilineae bacterium]HID33722.1 hypothetical protein [Anaerolineae bacterium]HIQ12450.1 hypothetical protein [Caldilineales bacterium]